MAILQQQQSGSSSAHHQYTTTTFRKAKVDYDDTPTTNNNNHYHNNGSTSSSLRRRQPKQAFYFQNIHVTIQLVLIIAVVVYIYVTLAIFWKLPITADTTSSKENLQAKTTPPPPKKKTPLELLQEQFPIPVNHSVDVETIEHPGKPFASHILKHDQKIPLQWNVTVPKFWNPPEYGGDIRQYLGNYGERLMNPEEALSIGSHVTIFDPIEQKSIKLETIFIAIASYRDPECITTIHSIFLRAKYPQRIRVAIIDQRIADDDVNVNANGQVEEDREELDPKCLTPMISCDEKPNQVLCKYISRKQIDGIELNAKLSVGPVFARHLGYRYYRGEYFAMQLDSHVRFVQDWDVDLVEQWKAAKNEMAVLSTYLSDLNGSIEPETHESLRKLRPLLCDALYEGEGPLRHLRLGQQPERPSAIHGQPLLHPFWAAGFSFSRGHFVIQVPYDQYLPMIFQGEEIAIGVRGFTYGYDYYAPERSVMFHMYAVEANKERRDKVPHFWEHQTLYSHQAEIQSMRRLNGVIGMLPASDPNRDVYNRIEEQKYGVGKVRTTQKYFATYGIHTETQTFEKHLCNFAGISMFNMFIQHLRPDGMGINFDKVDYQFTNTYGDQE